MFCIICTFAGTKRKYKQHKTDMIMEKNDYNQKVSLFQNLYSSQSIAIVMEEMRRLIMSDSDVSQKTLVYLRMKEALGKAKADEEMKQKRMPAVSVAVTFDGNGRQATHILGFTGLALVDLDHVADVDGAMAKVQTDPHTLLAYRTVSGEGLRIIYRYEREQADAHIDATSWRAAFLKGNEYFSSLTGCEYDAQCSDYARLCGLAHDPGAYANWQAQPFVVTDDDILAANFSANSGKSKPRREYAAGTYHMSIDDAWHKVEQALQRHGLVYKPGHHHDYVMHAAFMMNRYGVDIDELLERAGQEWGDYDRRQREATIRSCYRKTAEHGTWRLDRRGRKAKETSMITLPEIREWLQDHVEVIYNVVTDMTMWRAKGTAEWQQLDERVLCSMRSQMASDTGKRVLKNDVRDVLNSNFSRLFHPVREYIEALPQWDGNDRIGELASHLTAEAVSGGETQEQAQQTLRWALHKWLVAMVATWMSDHANNHTILVLIGQQGIYKTTFFRHLLPPVLSAYFWENAHNSFSSKDDHLAIAENCLVEIEEIDMQNTRDISELKALATSDKVKERRPYARFREEKARLASFCGSGNQQRFLCDDTGNRRWLCFKVSHIDDPRLWNIDYDQLYAQLHHDLKSGFQYWFNQYDQQRVERQNQAFRVESDEEQLIRTHLRPPKPGEKITFLNAAGISQLINGGTVGRGLSSRKIGIIMQRLGFKLLRKRQGNYYSVYVIPFDEVQSTLAMSDEKDIESSDLQCVEGDLPF